MVPGPERDELPNYKSDAIAPSEKIMLPQYQLVQAIDISTPDRTVGQLGDSAVDTLLENALNDGSLW